MYVLMQHLIAFKYACKTNHWKTNDYSQHLLFDRLSEDIDDFVDRIAECYFMASDTKQIFKKDILNPDLVNTNLTEMCELIIKHLEHIQNKGRLNNGMSSLLSSIEEVFLNKLALARLS